MSSPPPTTFPYPTKMASDHSESPLALTKLATVENKESSPNNDGKPISVAKALLNNGGGRRKQAKPKKNGKVPLYYNTVY